MRPTTRDAAATRQRILDVATAEFAGHGFAGGRVDRIAAAAGSNKTLIYRYFGSKDGLFDAVVDAAIARIVAEVPIDAADLAGYAVRMSDQFLRFPETDRLSSWDRLERDGRAQRVPAIAASHTRKVDAVRAAQASGVVTDRFPAEVLLQLVIAVALVPYIRPGTDAEPLPDAERHRLIRAAVTALVQP